MKRPDFNPEMVPDNDEAARLSPETSEGLEEADSLTQSGRAKAKMEKMREGTSTEGRFSKKHLEVKTGDFFVCLFLFWGVFFGLGHIALNKNCPCERSHGLNQEHLLEKEGMESHLEL